MKLEELKWQNFTEAANMVRVHTAQRNWGKGPPPLRSQHPQSNTKLLFTPEGF